jgi:hypothetical protein
MSNTALHPAQNRGFRELYASASQLAEHWTRLAGHLAGSEAAAALERGAAKARALVAELEPTTAKFDLYGQPAAQAMGAAIAGTRNALKDRTLERNQALRLAVLDVEHVRTLLGYLATVAECRNQAELAEFATRWQDRIRRVEDDVRKAAIAIGADPDAAIEPLDSSLAGRAAHRAAYAFGSVGEWLDRRASRRRGPAPGNRS